MPPAKKKPTVDEKPAAKVEDVKELDAPEVPAPDDEQTPAPLQDNETSGETSDEATDAADQGDEPDDAEDGEDEPQVGLVTEPCRVHFPDGWPVAEEGAWANCEHGHGIRYGEQVEITRERAVELGLITED